MWWSVVKIAIRIYQILQHWYTQKKLIHCVAIFTILYGNYYHPHGEFKLICVEKFARRTWVNFTQQYGKNCQSCQQNKFYYSVWQLLLHFYREFPLKILSVQEFFWHEKNSDLLNNLALLGNLPHRVTPLYRKAKDPRDKMIQELIQTRLIE